MSTVHSVSTVDPCSERDASFIKFIHKQATRSIKGVSVERFSMYRFFINAIIIYSGIFLDCLWRIRFILKGIRLCYGTWLPDTYLSALLIPVHCFTIVSHASLGRLCHLFFFPRYGSTCSGLVRPGLSEQCFK